jgi:hypothetical protein
VCLSLSPTHSLSIPSLTPFNINPILTIKSLPVMQGGATAESGDGGLSEL